MDLIGSRPIRTQQRHDQFIAVDAAEERAAPSNTFGLETDRLINATRPGVVRKQAERDPIGVGIIENALDKFRQHRLAVPAVRIANGEPLYERHAFARRPVAENSKSDRSQFCTGDEIGVAAFTQRRSMLRIVPAADQMFISRPPLGCHDEGNIRGSSSDEL